MDITRLIERIPDSVKTEIVNYQCGQVTYNGKRVDCIRITLDRLLTDDEKTEMKRKRSIFGTNTVAHLASAPEIKKSVFYIKY